jgi:hypothetical protein
MGNDNHVVVNHKLCGFLGSVCRRVVMMKEPVVVAPKFLCVFFFCTFLSGISKRHSKSQS